MHVSPYLTALCRSHFSLLEPGTAAVVTDEVHRRPIFPHIQERNHRYAIGLIMCTVFASSADVAVAWPRDAAAHYLLLQRTLGRPLFYPFPLGRWARLGCIYSLNFPIFSTPGEGSGHAL